MNLLIVGAGPHTGDHGTNYQHVMVLNKVVKNWPRANHHVSLHPCFTEVFKGLKHSNKPYRFVECVWEYQNNGGGSALFALHIALNMGYERIAFVGVPLSGEYGGNSSTSCWKRYRNEHLAQCERVRSFSGYTEKLFGTAHGWFDK